MNISNNSVSIKDIIKCEDMTIIIIRYLDIRSILKLL